MWNGLERKSSKKSLGTVKEMQNLMPIIIMDSRERGIIVEVGVNKEGMEAMGAGEASKGVVEMDGAVDGDQRKNHIKIKLIHL